MGGEEKVPRPARVTQSGQEANKIVLQEKEERFKSTINIILDEGHKKVNGKGGFTTSKISDDLLVPDKNATEGNLAVLGIRYKRAKLLQTLVPHMLSRI